MCSSKLIRCLSSDFSCVFGEIIVWFCLLVSLQIKGETNYPLPFPFWTVIILAKFYFLLSLCREILVAELYERFYFPLCSSITPVLTILIHISVLPVPLVYLENQACSFCLLKPYPFMDILLSLSVSLCKSRYI